MDALVGPAYRLVINEIADLPWGALTPRDTMRAAWAYYYFSIQFRESLNCAKAALPDDPKLAELFAGECDTDNLSPFALIAEPGERMNHDEFMRRTIMLSGLPDAEQAELRALGDAYLARTRAMAPAVRAMSIPTYEDGGLETVFRAILKAPNWSGKCLAAFRHFLVMHIQFDSDDENGHGALSRHLAPDDSVLPMWTAFRDLFVGAVPMFAAQQEMPHA